MAIEETDKDAVTLVKEYLAARVEENSSDTTSTIVDLRIDGAVLQFEVTEEGRVYPVNALCYLESKEDA